MASFGEAPDGDSGKGAKIFKTKCAQCHVAEKGGGHKQVCPDGLADGQLWNPANLANSQTSPFQVCSQCLLLAF